VQFCEKNHPELMPHVSTCRSPMEMFASVIKTAGAEDGRRQVHVAIMPCTAKKFEADREELKVDGVPMVDHVLTTQELVRMVKESGVEFQELEPEAVDMPFAYKTGAGVIFGVTGGVTEAVLRRLNPDKSPTALKALAFQGIRGLEGIKECTVPYGDTELKIAVVSGLGNASALIERIKAGEHYDFVEVMACPNGCVSGGGQPFAHADEHVKRGKGLYTADQVSRIKRSEDNPLMAELYEGLLKGRTHELLHVKYKKAQV